MRIRAEIIIKVIAIIFTTTTTVHTMAQDIVYNGNDSILIENIIKEHPTNKYETTGERIIALAKEFIGQTYVAGTLDDYTNEPLYISCDKFDCTTFVELVLAIAICKENTFADICSTVEQIRYRNGIRNGYTSRLHYISWWITDSAKQGIIEEIETNLHTAEQILNLNFMSSNSRSYKQLKEKKERTEAIAEHEKTFRNRIIRYIPKESINDADESCIKEGDIISIVTTIEGLDVSHIGFASYEKGKLHLIHASSSAGKVINDTISLDEYLKKRKNHLGIRIFRVTEEW